MFPLRTARRYLQPLREGGSLPAIVDTEEGGRFVVKFRGAGQGARALVAELLVGRFAAALGLPVPELVLVDVGPEFGRSEGDPEIQSLLQASVGVNVGLGYLDGAFNFDLLAAGDLIDDDFATRLVWLDAFTTNPDRTARNANLLVHGRRAYLIDHGAALYAHHDWSSVDDDRTRTPFAPIERHLLLTRASGLRAFDSEAVAALSTDVIDAIVDELPVALLPDGEGERDRYRTYFRRRIEAPRAFVDQAISARERVLANVPRPMSARR